jgi:hypothetical protein
MWSCSENKGTIGFLAVFACIAAAAWSAPALAAGSSLPYGGGGRFAKFDPIVQQYNQSGELFRIQGTASRPARSFFQFATYASNPAPPYCFTPAAPQKSPQPQPNTC